MSRGRALPGTRLLPGVVLLVMLAGCGGGADGAPDCGWDLRTDAGRQASNERLTFANQWITTNPGVPVPAPTSSYWRGECPRPSQVPPPPVEEGDQPND